MKNVKKLYKTTYMDRKNLQKQIDYCKYVAENSEKDDMKLLFKSIASNLEYLQRITKHTYFFFSDTEAASTEKFYEEHVKGRYFGAIGGGMSYKFTPNGLGQCVELETVDDKGNKITEDITDISSW